MYIICRAQHGAVICSTVVASDVTRFFHILLVLIDSVGNVDTSAVFTAVQFIARKLADVLQRCFNSF